MLERLLDNFKFMDPWPEWVRWIVILPTLVIIYAAASLLTVLIIETDMPTLWAGVCFLVATALFIWLGLAIAPRYKCFVGLVLGLLAFYTAWVGHWIWASDNTLMQADRFDSFATGIVGGIIIAWGLLFWGHLRRRRHNAIISNS